MNLSPLIENKIIIYHILYIKPLKNLPRLQLKCQKLHCFAKTRLKTKT